ncbi:MAG: GNAT family N-acetyltransferase [Phycisphaerales bacterium]
MENLKLIAPAVELKLEFLEMLEEFKNDGAGIINGIGSIDQNDFDNSVILAQRHSLGIDLPKEWVPASTYWLINEQYKLLGTCNLRHHLNGYLEIIGGHVGYSIRPSQRRKGYATKMLSLVIEKAKAMNIHGLLIVCDDANIASAKVIEKNGGFLINKLLSREDFRFKRRYWIDLI